MALKDHYRWYVSLERVKAELGITVATHDEVLKDQIEAAAAVFDRLTDRIFVPETRTRRFDTPESSWKIVLGYDLLALTALSDDVGDIDIDDVYLYSGAGVPDEKPYNEIQLERNTDYWQYTDSRQRVITVTGQWGYCDDYEDTGATLEAAITSTTATTITCQNGMVKTGDNLLIGSEQMFAVSIASSIPSDTITVRRGQGGTTAATHLLGVAIYRYVAPADVRRAVTELAKFYWQMRSGNAVKTERLGDYSVTYRDEPMPPLVKAAIQRYERLVYGSH